MNPIDLTDRLSRYLTVRELRVLLCVAEQGTFRKAAVALHMTQPAVTKAMADLEAKLGIKLYDRSTRGVEATVHGRSFIRHASAIFAEIRNAAQELEVISSGSAGRLIVGTVPMPAAGLLPAAIQQLLTRHPNIHVAVHEGNEVYLAEELRKRELDLVLSRMTQFGPSNDLRVEALYEDALCVIAHRSHPLACKARLSWSMVEQEAWVLPPTDTFFYHHILRVLNKRGLALPRQSIETLSIHIMYGMLAQAPMLSFAAVSQYVHSPLLRDFLALPVDLPVVTASIGAVTIKARQASPLAIQLATIIRSMTKDLPKTAKELAAHRATAVHSA